MSNYRIYSSAAYTVFRMGPGVEILQLGTNVTAWLQGEEADEIERQLDLVEDVEHADHALSQHFGLDQ